MRRNEIDDLLHVLRDLKAEITHARSIPDGDVLLDQDLGITQGIEVLEREKRITTEGYDAREIDHAYFALLDDVLTNGRTHDNRTAVKTLSVFGRQLKLRLGEVIPLLTTKRMFWKGIRAELIWMLSGNTNVGWLHEQGVHIWDEWADDNGDLGPVYGAQWRRWRPDARDQIKEVERALRENPDSRRHIVTAWNPDDLEAMSLPPCHCFFQFKAEEVSGGRILHCHMYQRSGDLFLGVPFDIASYALLTVMMADALGYDVGSLTISYGDLHLYENHIGPAREQLGRSPIYTPPVLDIHHRESVLDFQLTDVWIENYECHPPIRATVAV